MNHQSVHDAIIAKYKIYDFLGYGEIHHIIPRCMGGNNSKENLVRLPAKAHFIVHHLLAKIYGGKLIIAAFLMSKDGKHGSREYAWLREEYSKQISVTNKGRKFINRKPHTAEARAKMSAARKGRPCPQPKAKGRIPWNKDKSYKQIRDPDKPHRTTGQKRSAETKARCTLAQMGNTKGRGKLGKRYKQNNPRSSEHCEAIRIAALNRWEKHRRCKESQNDDKLLGQIASP